MKEIEKAYEPKKYEDKIYKRWELSGYFNPNNLPGKRIKQFSILMPPPNANGSLHAGHAVFVTIEDLLIRFRRMQGLKTLWLPGADHAGFETQVVYEKKLEAEGRSRLVMKPENLRKEIYDFTLSNKSFMENQLRQLGASCDWSRNTFTLDEKIIDAVYRTFKKLDEDKLLYRGNRSVNWCTKHQTSLSDLEQKNREQTDTLYYIAYGPFTIATVRPETIFGDVAIAVHPEDTRYKEWNGKIVNVETPIGTMNLKVIADDTVDMEFGTGALKITPAHDANDFAIAERHNLAAIEVIDKDGILNEKTGKYNGLSIDEARVKVIKDLEGMGKLAKKEEYVHTVPTCYKCGSTLEPRILPQWFIKTETLAKKAVEAVKKGKIVIVTKKFEKTFFHWMENINDWNISRQIVWGIPIPAKICDGCDEGYVDIEDSLIHCKKCKGTLRKDTDTFDTWFSSGQWPFAALDYPKGQDFKEYYPTDVMETGADIIFFWVARMVMLGIYRTGKVPFKKIYLHGLVKDKKGQKMSKSRGNVISPLALSEKYGTDALRLGLVIGNSPGNDMNLSEDKISAYGKFANKLWNISRYVIMNVDKEKKTDTPHMETLADEWVCAELNKTTQEVTKYIEEFHFSVAAEKLLTFTWDDFADWYIEVTKIEKNKDEILLYVLQTLLKLWHPFVPFITEKIWAEFDEKTMLMISEWPVAGKYNVKKENDFEMIRTIIGKIRNLKNIYTIPAKRIMMVHIECVSKKIRYLIETQRNIIESLAGVRILENIEAMKVIPESSLHFALAINNNIVKVYLPIGGMVDLKKEKARIEKEIKIIESYRGNLQKKLGDSNFIKNAPKDIVEKEQKKAEEAERKSEHYKEQLELLQ